MTTTRFSLSRAEDIVDEYQKLGLETIFLKPVSFFGAAKKTWPQISYSAEEFLEFYRRGFERVLEINLDGRRLVERLAVILLSNILGQENPRYLDLHSPCGAACSQLAYNYNGGVYACEKGRLLANGGDEIFWMGDADDISYEKLISSPVCKTLCVVSNLDSQPACSRCVYKPYCGICPAHSYAEQNSLSGYIPGGDRCKLSVGFFDLFFEKMKDSRCLDVFNSWVKGGGVDES